jgi:osmoprotectant transport system ATP-binding protein
VNLRVERGETVALVGESGSGKTTLLRTFNALVRPAEGEIRVGGRRVSSMDPVALRRSVGYVPQTGGLLPHWSVLRNAAMVPRLMGRPDAEAAGAGALARVGLDPASFGSRYPRSLSGGERQRVALARALAAEPGVILLDEPFGALDALTRSDAVALFRDVLAAGHVSALLVTHDLRVAFTLAGRIGVLRAGRLLQAGAPEELLHRPADPYVTALLERAGVAP